MQERSPWLTIVISKYPMSTSLENGRSACTAPTSWLWLAFPLYVTVSLSLCTLTRCEAFWVSTSEGPGPSQASSASGGDPSSIPHHPVLFVATRLGLGFLFEKQNASRSTKALPRTVRAILDRPGLGSQRVCHLAPDMKAPYPF